MKENVIAGTKASTYNKKSEQEVDRFNKQRVWCDLRTRANRNIRGVLVVQGAMKVGMLCFFVWGLCGGYEIQKYTPTLLLQLLSSKNVYVCKRPSVQLSLTDLI